MQIHAGVYICVTVHAEGQGSAHLVPRDVKEARGGFPHSRDADLALDERKSRTGGVKVVNKGSTVVFFL